MPRHRAAGCAIGPGASRLAPQITQINAPQLALFYFLFTTVLTEVVVFFGFACRLVCRLPG